MNDPKLYILMISVHGLLRGQDMELGRDADTGGQITYVVELAKALGRNPQVEQIDLLTRLIEDPQVSDDYAQPEEPLSDNVRIVRLPCGPQRYLRKEMLWPHLDHMVDRCLHLIRQQGRLPDIIHTHYADAGYVGMQLSNLLGIPQVHTGHSLGRPKRQRLLDSGRKEHTIEKQLNLSKRINVEEQVLAHASLVVTSTRQEISDQYGMYNASQQCQFSVIPPGTDTSRFFPPGRKPIDPEIVAMVNQFLQEPGKPFILAICRPDTRKNLHGLIAAYGENPQLQEIANLVIVAGTREGIRKMEDAQRKVMTDLLLDIDKYNLWGKVAIPKNCMAEQIPELYRLAVKRRGVFVNPALTEPFGLTLIEAAASGLPFVATEDGGPVDIVANCHSGILVNPLYPEEISRALMNVLSDRHQWFRWSHNGILGVRRHYSWDAHVSKYLKAIKGILHRDRKRMRRVLQHSMRKTPMPFVQKAIITDIDNTLLGDERGLRQLIDELKASDKPVAFGVATGRTLESTIRVLKKWRVPMPDVLITSVGSEIHYWPTQKIDTAWRHHISHNWRRDDLARLMATLPGMRLQPEENQREFKLSYYVIPDKMPPLRKLYQLLREHRLQANLVYSHQAYLDVLPERASKGRAIRYLSYKWGVPLQNFLVAGDSGNDEEMLVGDTLGIVVGNHSPELEPLRGLEQIYFAEHVCARGVLEGIEHYDFLQTNTTRQKAHT